MQQVLRTGLVLILILTAIGAASLLTGALGNDATNPTNRACQDAIASTRAQIASAVVQNPGLATRLATVSNVTRTVPISIYETNARIVNASVTANSVGNIMTLTATMPTGQRCATTISLTNLSLPSNTTTNVNPAQQPHE